MAQPKFVLMEVEESMSTTISALALQQRADFSWNVVLVVNMVFKLPILGSTAPLGQCAQSRLRAIPTNTISLGNQVLSLQLRIIGALQRPANFEASS